MQIKLKGIHAVRSKGKIYYYHRKTRKKIDAEPNTLEFLKEFERLESGAVEAPVSVAGTLGALIERYQSSPEWLRLKKRTQEDYQGVFDFLKKADMLGMPTKKIQSKHVIHLRDRAFRPASSKGKTRRRFSTLVIQVLSTVFSWGRPRGLIPDNPATGVPKIKKPKDAPIANRPWRPEEREAVMKVLPIHLKLPVGLAMYAMLREGDVLNCPPSVWTGEAIDLERQGKTGRPLWVPAHSQLKKIVQTYLAWAKKKGFTLNTHLCVNSRGKPWTSDGFSASLSRYLRKLQAEDKVGKGLTMHGLRHTAGKLAADGGANSKTIAALLGHQTVQMAEHYSREADRRLAATRGMKLLDQEDTDG